jgi:hypothetical protein
MTSISRWLLLSLLLAALYSQSAPVSSLSTYTEGSGTFVYIVGSGQQGAASLGQRNSSRTSVGEQPVAYTPPAEPTPVKIDCPFNQVYDNILCQCVCIIGFHFQGSDCVLNTGIDVTCGRNEIYRDGRCVCGDKFYLIGSACDVCPPYSAYDLTTLSCKCIPGYTLVNGACALPFTPPPPAPRPVVPTCSINQQLVNGICQCRQGFFLIRGTCT